MGLDRIAVMAALNISENRSFQIATRGLKTKNWASAESLNETLEAALVKNTQLEL